MVDTSVEKIDALLSRSVAEILPSQKDLREALLSGKRLRIYIGTDATGAALHLGHATNYMILERFRQLGHDVIFLIGDFTSRIGDPTDKSDSTRKQLTREQVVANTKTWMDQIRPVIDINNKDNPITVLYNHDWLAKLTFEDVLNLASNFTVQQMIERDMFQKRIVDGKPLYLHELFYPLMQGYDSVAMDVDIELCGEDQKFNALAGRTLLKKLKDKEKFVLISTLLENPITGEKMMSKSIGTGVFLDVDARTMYGGIMAQPDENMRQLFVDCTLISLKEIEQILKGGNPRDIKMRLAFEITKLHRGIEKATDAQNYFVSVFQEKKIPTSIRECRVHGSSVIGVLVETGLAESKSDAKRLIEQGAIRIDKELQKDDQVFVIPPEGSVLQKGKKDFVKIIRDKF